MTNDAQEGSHLGEDRQAFATVIDRHGPGLLRYFRVLGLGTADAEDLCQDTFLRAWQARHRYDPRYAPTTWLYTIGHRLAVNHLRRRRPQQILRDDQAITDDTSSQADDLGGLWAVSREHLSPKHHELLWLHYGESLDHRAIATVTGSSGVAVRVALHRARQKLKRILAERHPELIPLQSQGVTT